MTKGKLATIGIIIIVLAIAAAIIYSKNAGFATKDIATEAEAKWIGEHSIVYTQAGCIHCKELEDLFGSSWKYINSIDCASSQEKIQACIVANITATPTWIINGEQYIGVQTVEKLKELTGYK